MKHESKAKYLADEAALRHYVIEIENRVLTQAFFLTPDPALCRGEGMLQSPHVHGHGQMATRCHLKD